TILSLAGCATGQGRPRLPYDTWYVGIAAPRFMEVWVESVDVIDRRGYAYFDIHGGVVSYTGDAKGWPARGISGKVMPANKVDLPETLCVRWQSLVEPQTYKLRIDIPQWVRDEMVKPQRTYCQGSKSWETDYRKMISIGMAPGGIAKAWLGGPCLSNIEIGRYQAKVDSRGPSQGKTNGQYAWPSLEPESAAYIKEHGIPYGSW